MNFEPEDSSDEEDSELVSLTLPVIMRAAKRAKTVAKSSPENVEELLNAEDITVEGKSMKIHSLFDPDCVEHLEEPSVKKELKSFVNDVSKRSVSFSAVLNTVRHLLSNSAEANAVFFRNAGVATLFKHLRLKNDIQDATQALEVLSLFFSSCHKFVEDMRPLTDALYKLLNDLCESMPLFPGKGERSEKAKRSGKVYRHNWIAALHVLCNNVLCVKWGRDSAVGRNRNVVFDQMLTCLQTAFKKQDIVAVKHVFETLA